MIRPVFRNFWCWLLHCNKRVIAFYSNRTHRFRCLDCGREYDE